MNSIHNIANHNGKDMIHTKLLEEVNELVEAIKEGNQEHIIEEMADVFIMINQYTYIHNQDKEFFKQVNNKLKRTTKRLNIKEK